MTQLVNRLWALGCSHQSLVISITALMLLGLCVTKSLALGGDGWSNTRLKVEHQYTDYNSYRYPPPIPPEYPETVWLQYDPYIADFPEHRTLVRLTQAFGPKDVMQIRWQYSDLTDNKNQRLYFVQYAHDVHPMMNIFANYQYLRQPGWLSGWMTTVGARFNRSGWILAEFDMGYIRNRVYSIATDTAGVHPVAGSEHTVETYAPMASFRYSFDGSTAASLRWDGSFARSSSGNVDSHALTMTMSRHLPTRTALHLLYRFYDNSAGVQSHSSSFEVAQYILWNLTARVSYRYYENGFDDPALAVNLERGAVHSNSFTLWSEYHIRADLKLHLKLRRYESNQSIRMNTYLLGFEWTI